MQINEFDLVVVGASPVLVIEALVHSEAGKKVLLLDNGPSLGGAWGCSMRWGHQMDSGAHLFYHRGRGIGEVYNFVQEITETNFKPFMPQPRGEKVFGISPSPESAFLKFSKVPIRQRVSAFSCLIKECLSFLQKEPYLYPEGGCLAWLRNCENKLKKNGCELRFSTSLRTLSVERGRVHLVTDSETFVSKKAVLSARVELDHFDFNKEIIALPFTSQVLFQKIMMLEDQSPPAFSYYKFNEHPYFFIAGDLSKSLFPLALPSQKIIAIALNKGIDGSEFEDEYVRQELTRRKLINKNAVLKLSEITEHHSIQRDEKLVLEVNEKIRELEFVFYNNMMLGLGKRLVKWKKCET